VGGERAAATPSVGIEGELYQACGERSIALERIASALAVRRAAGRPPPGGRAIALAVQAGGVAQPWPRAWSAVGSDDDVKQRFGAWLANPAGLRGTRRCGIGRAIDASQRNIVTAVTVDALAELTPLPRRSRVGSWVSLDAHISASASEAAVVLLGPDGAPKRVFASLSDGAVRSRFNLDRAGEWSVQVVATLASGPEPVLEARLFAGDEAEPSPAEPNFLPEGLGDVQVLMRSLMAERRERGLGPLKRSDDLDRIATRHAAQMAERGDALHDAGDGDPVERAHAAGIAARLVGENVARAETAALAHRALWESPSHRGNMLSRHFRRIGVGVVKKDGVVWVVELFTD
jgi:hypothetical protein